MENGKRKERVLLFGDSVTDMSRDRSVDFTAHSYGNGYGFFVEGELSARYPLRFEVINRGVGGDRIVDLYARVKRDCWNLNPDYLSILIGVNDVWHEISDRDGVDSARYERVYRMLLEETLQHLPQTKIILMEPFYLNGSQTREHRVEFAMLARYSEIARGLAAEYKLAWLPLQKRLDALAEKYGAEFLLSDGVHPTVAGAKVLADEWLNCFEGLLAVNRADEYNAFDGYFSAEAQRS